MIRLVRQLRNHFYYVKLGKGYIVLNVIGLNAANLVHVMEYHMATITTTAGPSQDTSSIEISYIRRHIHSHLHGCI